MNSNRTIAIVGASLAGLRTLEALRKQGFTERIIMVGEELHMPYTRPPLSKKLLNTGGELTEVLLKTAESEHDTEWRLGRRAVACDLETRTLTLDDASTIEFDGLVAATGVRSRRLPGDGGSSRMVLRTIDDSVALSERLVAGTRLVIAGAGFIGCEVAAAAIARGCSVTIVALDAAPMLMPLGAMLGQELQRRHEAAGVTFYLRHGIDGMSTSASGSTLVKLDDGTVLEADIVVEAIGSIPNVDWLSDNDLDLRDGVLCDEYLRMVRGSGSVRGALAVGDVARFPNALFGAPARRVEHWQIAGDTARAAATTLLHDLDEREADLAEFATLPTFWSDQKVVSIRAFGSPGLGDTATVLEGDITEQAAIGYHREGTLVGVVLLGLARRGGFYAAELTRGLSSTPTAAA
ncbi:MAG: Ferredoxin reductase [Subtercola sp.]|nr:Ferredoxin reductase [Subtercola sp.]